MESIIASTTAAAPGTSVPANADAPRVAQTEAKRLEDALASLLPSDQSVQAVDQTATDEGVKERDSALARVEKALSEAFGSDFVNLRLEVAKDEESGRFVYKAVNKESGQVERQFPSEEMLRILSSFEGRDGKFLDDTA
ncbi:MAG: flagellar protein FlaG [Pseudomonadota bacterium]